MEESRRDAAAMAENYRSRDLPDSHPHSCGLPTHNYHSAGDVDLEGKLLEQPAAVMFCPAAAAAARVAHAIWFHVKEVISSLLIWLVFFFKIKFSL